MSDWMILATYFVGGVMVLMMALGLGISIVMPGIERWSRRFFTAFFSVLLLCMGVIFIDSLIYEKPNLILAERIVIFFEYLLSSIVMPMLTAYLLHCCGEDWRCHPLFRAAVGLWLVSFILLIIAQFTTCFYYVTQENVAIRGPWHPLLMLPMVAIMPLTLAYLIRMRKRLSRRNYWAFLIYLLPMTVALLIHMFIFVALFVYISIAICALAMYSIILSDQIEQYTLQQREIAHQRSSIMVLQMRPHFIHNTMTTIYCLCNQDPQKARQVTLDFNTYLRRNFTAIASEEPIPFSEELEHTRAYLAVEQAQFEDSLFIDYDTPHTLFRLPPLTLQPIVENAVKHGMDPDSEPLHILIRTRKLNSGSEVIVEDNGSGFGPYDETEPHIALSNIRQRLEMMCRGKLTILPREGGGTVVKVTIP